MARCRPGLWRVVCQAAEGVSWCGEAEPKGCTVGLVAAALPSRCLVLATAVCAASTDAQHAGMTNVFRCQVSLFWRLKGVIRNSVSFLSRFGAWPASGKNYFWAVVEMSIFGAGIARRLARGVGFAILQTDALAVLLPNV